MSRSSKYDEKSDQEESSSEDEQSVVSVRSVSGSECSAAKGKSWNLFHTRFGVDMDSSSVRSSTSSSSGSIATAKKSCSKRRRICRMSTGTSPRRIVPPARKLEPEVIELSDSEDEEVADVEDQALVDIFEDDDDEHTYKDLSLPEMECLICEKKFKLKQQFILHHRRHVALEHFQCPTCSRGFTTLSLCLQHEIKMHRGMNKEGVGATGQSKSACSDDDQDEDWLKVNNNRVITSNHLIMYRGPKVRHFPDCFDIEEKHGYRNSGLTPMQEQMRISRAEVGLHRPGPPARPIRIHKVN